MKYILSLIGFALLIFAGLFGLQSWPKPETSIGYFTVSKNPYGVAVYQADRYASVQFESARGYSVQGQTVTIVAPKAITYSRDDIIFDKNGTLYTEPKIEEIDYLSRSLGTPLTKVENPDRTIPIPVGSLYLVNPHVPGMLEFRISTGPSVRMNRDQKQIGGWTDTTIAVIVHDTYTL